MQPIRHRQWKLRAEEPDPQRVKELARSAGVSSLLARILCQRGYQTAAAVSLFLQGNLADLPDPALLPQMAEACHRLQRALERGEKIAVHGDYDVDGISGCTLLVEVLRSFGGNVDYHIPLRLTDGYGLSADAIRRAAENSCRVLISVDCGVSAHAEAQLAADLGIDLIITDHHQPPENLPLCTALINPHLSSSHFPYAELAGVGVAFFLLIALRKKLRESNYFSTVTEPDLRHSLDLVALGTIADIVPLTGVNRILVKAGLRLLNVGDRPGITALKQVAKVTSVNSGVVGFRLAPRLNAAGRIEDAAQGVKLLLGDTETDLETLAQQLDCFNQERQALERKVLNEAISQIEQQNDNQRRSIVLASPEWHSGVIGIVASRLVERYHRPTVLVALADGIGKGSGRSIRDYHLYQALQDCAEFLDGFGGHAMAAGLTVNEKNLSAFVHKFEEVAIRRLSPEMCLPTLHYDGEFRLDLWQPEVVQSLEVLSPFGAGNPQPLFVSRHCMIKKPYLVAGQHVKVEVEQGGVRCPAIAFGFGERIGEFSGALDLLYRPVLNTWQGKTTVQLQISDFCPTEL